MTGALIPSLIKAASDAAILTSATNNSNKGLVNSKSKVLGDTLTDPMAKTEKEEKQEKEIKSGPRKLTPEEEIDLMYEIMAGSNLTTKDLNQIMKTGYITADQINKVTSGELRKKLARMGGEEVYRQVMNSMPPNNNDDDDNDDENDEDKEKDNKLKEKIKKEVEKYQKYDEKEKEFIDKENARTNKSRWGSTEYTDNPKIKTPKEDSRELTNNLERYMKRNMTESELNDWNSPSARTTRLKARDAHKVEAAARAAKEDELLKEIGLNIFLK